MTRKFVTGFLVFLILIALLYFFQPEPEIHYVEETRFMMDTVVRIVVYDHDFPRDSMKQAISAAFEKVDLIEQLCSTVIDSSEISQVNRSAGVAPVKISEPVKKITESALQLSKLSAGAFDISILPASRKWNFYDSSKPFQKANAKELQQAISKVDYQKLELNNHSLFLKEKGMEIDVGGIAKGYAIDLAFETLKNFGLKDFQVDAGGDLRFLAGPVSTGKRKIWIKHPRNRSQLWGYFKLDTGSVATSGDYERFFMIDSLRFHHILDPHTGYPAQKSVSVTIIAQTAMDADAFATAVFVLGPEAGLKLVESQSGIDAVILYFQNGELKTALSSGIKDKFIKDTHEVNTIN